MMMIAFRARLACALIVLVGLLGSTASADPLPGQVLKFQQLPLRFGKPGVPYPGHDELSTALVVKEANGEIVGWQGTYMADDFADRFNTPVVHVRWWGSYMQTAPPLDGVQQFLISFESDIPATDLAPSHPGEPLLNQIVDRTPVIAPGSGTFTEKLINADVAEPIYEYNAELFLDKQFQQQPDTVYWLKIVALVDPERDGPLQWGWHNRDWSLPDPLAGVPPVGPGEHIAGFVGPMEREVWHFQDDAVTGNLFVEFNSNMPNMPNVVQSGFQATSYIDELDGPEGIMQFSKDLAFELYTIPEPSTFALLAAGAVALVAIRRRRRCV